MKKPQLGCNNYDKVKKDSYFRYSPTIVSTCKSAINNWQIGYRLLKEHTNLYPRNKKDIALDIHMQKITIAINYV